MSALGTFAFLIAFGIAAFWESRRPRRAPLSPIGLRWTGNIGLYLVNLTWPVALGVLWPTIVEHQSYLDFRLVAGLPDFLPHGYWVSVVVGVLAIDLLDYGTHRLNHLVPAMWRFHTVHHSDFDLDSSTAIRHHPVQYLFGRPIGVLGVLLIGMPAESAAIYGLISGPIQFLHHANVAWPERIDRALRRAIVTPNMHRIHHSLAAEEGNSNFGQVFSIWDRMFATYRDAPAAGHEAMELGLPEYRAVDDQRFGSMLLAPFRR